MQSADLVDRAIARLNQTIESDDIDWNKWMKPSEKARIIPAENFADQCKRDMMLGPERQSGMCLPWAKSKSKVLIRPGKVAVWSGWSHHGKTAMLKQVMLYAIKQGERVMIASMEEEPRDLWQDLCLIFCGNDTPTPRMVDEFVAYITGRLWIYDQQGAVEAMRMIALNRYASSELKITQSVIDSLMMLSMDREDYDAQSRFVSELKSAAKDTQTTLHLVAHMRKRDGKTGDDNPGNMHDISGGHEITSKADYVFNVWRNRKPDTNDAPSCILGVEKQRGRRPYNWIGRIGLDYHAQSGQFVEGNHAMRFEPDYVDSPSIPGWDD